MFSMNYNSSNSRYLHIFHKYRHVRTGAKTAKRLTNEKNYKAGRNKPPDSTPPKKQKPQALYVGLAVSYKG